MFALYRAVSVCPYKPSRDGGEEDDAVEVEHRGLNIAHLGCFWRFEVRMYMLVLHRPRVGNVQKHPTSLCVMGLDRDDDMMKWAKEGQGVSGSTNLL